MMGQGDHGLSRVYRPFDYEFVRERRRQRQEWLALRGKARVSAIVADRNAALRRSRQHDIAREMAAGLNDLRRYLPVIAALQQGKRVDVALTERLPFFRRWARARRSTVHRASRLSMSPFIRRTVVSEPECTAGTLEIPHEFYVPRAELQPGDVVLDPKVTDRDSPKFIRPAVLAGLAVQFPREFEAAAKARGVLAEPNADADDTGIDGLEDDDDETGGDDLGEQAKVAAGIVALNADEVAKAIAACKHNDVLAALAAHGV